MSIGTITLNVLRSDLRARINEISPNNFSNAELNRWLNVGQQETAIRLKDLNEIWYLARKNITINSADNGNDYIDLSGANYFTTD